MVHFVKDEHKWILDVTSIGALIGYFADWLPLVATVLTIVWTAIRIYETRTFRGLILLLRKLLGKKIW